MMKIAVTGGAASGKSMVCKRVSEKGITVIILDDLSRMLMLPGTVVYNRVVSEFGDGILNQDGTLNRQSLRRMITSDPESKKKLESIVQPAIREEMNRRIDESRDRGEVHVVVEVPLLFELGMEKGFDRTILVAVQEETQIIRLVQRDGVSEDDALRLLKLQMPLSEKLKKADIVLDNNGSPENLIDQVDRLLANIFNK